MNDGELARRCIVGDPSAWEELVRRNLDLVHRTVGRVLGASEADVEDVLQTLFLKLMEEDCRRLRSFQGRSKLSTWLVAVARREALDFLEKKGRAPATPPGSQTVDRLASDLAVDPGTAIDAVIEAKKVQAALDRLPARDSLLLQLVCVDGASYEEAARLLTAPLNSISPWLGRSKERLRAILAEERCTDPGPSSLQ
jgi:RNA polymerase sigma-70 factor (ECF subfamily)